MSSTWVIGDIHGCAEELAELLERLQPGGEDRVIAVGDLYHRGPDPLGVAALLAGVGAEIVLGNHEHVLLRRLALLGGGAPWSGIPAEDLAGDGGTPLAPVDPARSAELLEPLRGRPYFLRGQGPEGPWLVVHAGVLPGRRPEETPPRQLVRLRRLQGLRGEPFWFEVWEGPELVLFGHTSGRVPRRRVAGGRLVALGLDTGCVYGGALTAFRIEDGELEAVPARRRYAGS
ncbi:MAG: hypothetical protein D6702_04720 [Planctomycetota bacterium]|nr:MAG: hypothetical protein D6702_04720 [Planctomycetota bacterium]